MKICSKCGLEKELTEFNKRSKGSIDGYRSQCKICRNSQIKEWIVNNQTHIKEYKEKKKEQIKKYKLEYREENKEKINIYRLEYKRNNKDIINNIKKRYYKNNKDKINIYKREYSRNKMETDSIYKLSRKIRILIVNSIKNNGYTKNSKTYDILGCSFEEFKTYIENKFENWMTFNNHGKYTGNYNETWQYDHIKPISLGMSKEEIIKLNHYTNFQPLCSRKNLEKSNKFIPI
jgi:hypothetical protein